MSLKSRLKKAWYQGADEPSFDGAVTSNDPMKLGGPGKMEYPKAPMATTAPGGQDTRPWEQTWFENAAKDTKKVMGPQGSEMELKKKMQRAYMDDKVANAKLSATFTRTASPKASYWSVFATNKKTAKKELILKATLEELWGDGLTEQTANDSATTEYGQEIIARIRKQGFAKVAYLMTGNTSLMKKADFEAPVGVSGEGSELAEVNQAVDGAAEEGAQTADSALAEIEEMEAKLETAEDSLIQLLPEEAKEVAVEIQTVEKTLEGLAEEQKEISARLRDKTISASAKIAILKIAEESLEAVIPALEGAEGMTNAINEEIASVEALAPKVEELVNKAQEISGGAVAGTEGVNVEEGIPAGLGGEEAPAAEGAELDVAASGVKELTVAQIKNFLNKRAEAKAAEEQKYNVVPAGAPKDGKGEIAAAHPQGGLETGGLVVGLPVANKGGRVETVTEAQDHDLKVADKMPTGELNNTISVASAKGKGLTATASVDAATKEYYKQYFGQVEGGAEFAKALTADYENKVKAAVEETEGRVKRAFELAEIASTKGMCEPSTAGKIDLFNKIAKFDDNAFVAFKEAVEAMPVKRVFASEERTVKTASAKMPIVGQRNVATSESFEDFSALSVLGWSK